MKRLHQRRTDWIGSMHSFAPGPCPVMSLNRNKTAGSSLNPRGLFVSRISTPAHLPAFSRKRAGSSVRLASAGISMPAFSVTFAANGVMDPSFSVIPHLYRRDCSPSRTDDRGMFMPLRSIQAQALQATEERDQNGQQDDYRCIPSGRNPGGRASRQ